MVRATASEHTRFGRVKFASNMRNRAGIGECGLSLDERQPIIGREFSGRLVLATPSALPAGERRTSCDCTLHGFSDAPAAQAKLGLF